VYAKFQLSSFETEGGERGDRWREGIHMLACNMVVALDIVAL